jgi:CheY-like chemotaxis protein
MPEGVRPADVLLVEDNPGDVRLTREAFEMGDVDVDLHVVEDGDEALDFLYAGDGYADRPRPDLVLLDLNLPKRDGREVLDEAKTDEDLAPIPIVILTTSEARQDVLATYGRHANCFVTKPVDLDDFLDVVRGLESFWLDTVRLPARQASSATG